MSEQSQPVIALLDMDCFYVQVETREKPHLAGKPAAVVQYNTWKGGGIIAVNYEARAKGVSRNMRGDEARDKCPEIELVMVPINRDKANLSKYRKAGREVIEVLLDSGAVVERASIDEAYLDLTKLVEQRLANGEQLMPEHLPNTWLGGETGDREIIRDWCHDALENGEDDLRLAVGAKIMEEIRADVYRRTQFRCSAGLAHCKTLAKLCCGLNKPNKQTVLPASKMPNLYENLKVTKVRGLGGKLGDSVVHQLGVETMGQLSQLSAAEIGSKFEPKTAHWLLGLCKGKDGEIVKERELPKSIGCGKNFRGKEKLDTKKKVEEKVENLVEELVERLEEDRDDYSRVATGLTVGIVMENIGHSSRVGPLQMYSTTSVFSTVMGILIRLNTSTDKELWSPALVNVSISASKFIASSSSSNQSITSFFTASNEAPSQRKFSQVTSEPDAGSEPILTKKPSIMSFFSNKSDKQENDKLTNIAGDSNESDKEEDKSSEKEKGQISGKSDASLTAESTSKDENVEPPKQPQTVSFFRTHYGVKKEKKVKKVKQNIVDNSMSLPRNEIANDYQKCDNSTTKVQSVNDKFSDDDLKNLIPSIEEFDSSLLELLPKTIQLRAKQRLKQLNDEQNAIKSPNIRDLLIPKGSNEENLEPINCNEEDLVECDQCKKKISPFTLPEHMDWHLAVNLSKQNKTNTSQTDSGKRKRDSEGGLNKLDSSKKPCQRGIANYFRKS